jgi:predicted small metal-binding protein
MTKRLECVIEGCHATIEAESEDAVMAQVGAHAADAHPDLELDDETVETIRSSVRDV